MSADTEKTLEQMLVELGERQKYGPIITLYFAVNLWTCQIETDDETKHYRASTPMGAVVQAYRDR